MQPPHPARPARLSGKAARGPASWLSGRRPRKGGAAARPGAANLPQADTVLSPEAWAALEVAGQGVHGAHPIRDRLKD